MTIDTWHLRNDATLWQDVQAMLRISPRLLVLWRPDVKKYSGYLLKEVPASQQPADSNAACSILAEMRPPDALSVGILMRFWQADIRNEKVLLNGVTDILACASSPITSVGQAYATSKGLPVFNGTGLTNKVQVRNSSLTFKLVWCAVHWETRLIVVTLVFSGLAFLVCCLCHVSLSLVAHTGNIRMVCM
jgi:hypothetical protein